MEKLKSVLSKIKNGFIMFFLYYVDFNDCIIYGHV